MALQRCIAAAVQQFDWALAVHCGGRTECFRGGIDGYHTTLIDICMTSAMSEYLFRFEAIKVEKNMAVKGKGQKPKNEVKSKKYQTFRGDMLQLKESRAILLH